MKCPECGAVLRLVHADELGRMRSAIDDLEANRAHHVARIEQLEKRLDDVTACDGLDDEAVN